MPEILILSRKNTNKQRKDGFRDADRGKISELLIPVFLENFEPIEGEVLEVKMLYTGKGDVYFCSFCSFTHVSHGRRMVLAQVSMTVSAVAAFS